MKTLTVHATERLDERHNVLCKRDLNIIAALVEQRKFQILEQNIERQSWTVVIRFNNRWIRLVINPFIKCVITALP
jgi:hypothetical protein